MKSIYLDVSKLSQEQLEFLGKNLEELDSKDRICFVQGKYYIHPSLKICKYLLWMDSDGWVCLDVYAIADKLEVSYEEFVKLFISQSFEEISTGISGTCCLGIDKKIDLLDDDKLSKIGEILIYFDFETVSVYSSKDIKELKKDALELMDKTWRKCEQEGETMSLQHDGLLCTAVLNGDEINLNLKYFLTEWNTTS